MKDHKLRTLGSLGAASLLMIHLYNRYISRQSGLKEVLTLYNYQYFSFKGGRIFYIKKGSGSPLLLIHDLLPGGSGYEWTRVEDELSKKHTLYIIDLPGCGRSAKEYYEYTNSFFVQVISTFVRDVIKEKCDVMTSGASSSIILMANLYQEHLFDRIIMVNPVSLSSAAKRYNTRGKLYQSIIRTPIFGTLIYNMHVSKESVSSLFVNQYYYNPFHVERDVMDAYYEAAHLGGFHCKDLYSSLASGYYHADLKKALTQLKNRTLMISGANEKNGKRIQNEYLKYQPSIEKTLIYQCKHIPHIEMPDEFLNHVNSFL